MKRVLALAAVSEAATGLALVVVPSLVGHLLLRAELAGNALAVARVTGIALVALGIACWPDDNRESRVRAFQGMLCYSLFVTLYLAYLGIGGEFVGPLLWPAVVVHLVLTLLLVWPWLRQRKI